MGKGAAGHIHDTFRIGCKPAGLFYKLAEEEKVARLESGDIFFADVGDAHVAHPWERRGCWWLRKRERVNRLALHRVLNVEAWLLVLLFECAVRICKITQF